MCGNILKRAQKKAQSSTGAPLILVIILVLVLYIILLPPENREELLNSGSVTLPELGGSTNRPTDNRGVTSGDEFVFEGPGNIDFVRNDAYQHNIPAQSIYTRKESAIIAKENTFAIERGWFSNESFTVTIPLTNLNNLENILMTFVAPVNEGILSITLNGKQIYRNDVQTRTPVLVRISHGDLMQQNTFLFEVSGVGGRFWKTNKYTISDLTFQADVTDVSRSAGEATFSLRSSEALNLDRATLRFIPECQVGSVGTLTGYINGQRIFSRIPDCGIANIFSIDKNLLREGTNTVQFSTTDGNYLIDNIRVDTQLDDSKEYVYYFALDEDLFSYSIRPEPICGQMDGICPSNCGEDIDRDCCFNEYRDGFWCDVPTTLQGDRCVGTVNAQNIFRCPSGYEDRNGRVHKDFKGICGDDHDGVCPTGCSQYYDKDCCFNQPGDQYFCENMPVTGITDICVQEVSSSSCLLCAGGYKGERNSPSACFQNANPLLETVRLKEEYKATAKLFFLNNRDSKVATIKVNGYATRIDTRDDYVEIDISSYAKDNSNYIQIIPESRFNLAEIRIDIGSSGQRTPIRRTPYTYYN